MLRGRVILPAPARLPLLALPYCATTLLAPENSEMLPAGLVAVAAMVRPKATFWSVSPAAHDKEVGIQLLGQG